EPPRGLFKIQRQPAPARTRQAGAEGEPVQAGIVRKHERRRRQLPWRSTERRCGEGGAAAAAGLVVPARQIEVDVALAGAHVEVGARGIRTVVEVELRRLHRRRVGVPLESYRSDL